MSLDSVGINTVSDMLSGQTSLESLIKKASDLTINHFSKKEYSCKYWPIKLYAPIYASNFCVNQCLYCGFRAPDKIVRNHLCPDETLVEADVLISKGITNILLVAGESPRITPEYMTEIIAGLVRKHTVPSIEIAPQSETDYAKMVDAGCHGVTLFQETYDQELYKKYHPAGPKSDFSWRFHAIERAAKAGMKQLGFGFLVGLADPGQELCAMIEQARELKQSFPECRLAFNLPRLHTSPGGFRPSFPTDDEFFIKMYCVLRIFFPDADMVLSTRERVELRNRLAGICITQMSAGSSTAPGGYTQPPDLTAPQFEITDERSIEQVKDWLTQNGFQPIC